jgi:hypothetical protein
MSTNIFAGALARAALVVTVISLTGCSDALDVSAREAKNEPATITSFPAGVIPLGGGGAKLYRAPQWQRVLDIGKSGDPVIEEWKKLSRDIDKLLKKSGKSGRELADGLSRINFADAEAGSHAFAALLGISAAENERLAARAASVAEAVYRKYPELKDPDFLRNTLCKPARSAASFGEIAVNDDLACEQEQRASNTAFTAYVLAAGGCAASVIGLSPGAFWACAGAIVAWRVYTEANFALEYCWCVEYFSSYPEVYGPDPESYCGKGDSSEDGDGGVWN